MAELQHFKILDRPSVQITHCSGRIGLKTRMHAASSWPRDSLPLVLIKLHAIANLYSINMWLYSYSATSRNQSILLLFSPIFFWKSFFWPIIYMLKILFEVLMFYSQLSYMAIVSYLTVTSYTLYISTVYTHGRELYS